MLLDSKEIHLLTEVGFLAAAKSDLKRSVIIFSALKRLRPEGLFVYVGWACALMNSQQHEAAIEVLSRGVERVEKEDLATLQAFLALAYQLAGRSSESSKAIEAAHDCRLGRLMAGHI